MNYFTAMEKALVLAQRAMQAGDVPVGAVVLDENGEIIGEGYNRREFSNDPLAHAEIEALRNASMNIGAWNFSQCTIVVTLEPCPMCAGALLQAHMKNIVFGAWDNKMGACGSIWDIPRDRHIGHKAQVYGGVLEDKCASLLNNFFMLKRDVA
ncbi:MAG: nucleoside deaminase [Bifidobacteriaceae bacterium]|nr:nucleoside deaminase [Bifidobacteriaceae bacterium]